MTAPIALQLYTLREEMAADFAGTVRKVAEMGYVGVETAGFPGTVQVEAVALFKELGLSVPSAHMPLPLGEKQQEVLDTAYALGCEYIFYPATPRDQFQTVDQVKAVAAQINEANAVARANGLKFGWHNHWWEYLPVDGRPAYKILLEELEPDVLFEIDTYWVQTAGLDAAAVVSELKHRAPLLHIKDGPADAAKSMQAVGDGVMDIPAVIAAGAETSEWLIVEIDRCDTDMTEAVQQSYTYLVGEGLARGNR